MQDAAPYLLLALLAYPYFWFHSFDPNLRVRIYSKERPEQRESLTFTTVPGPVSLSALFWTAMLVLPLALPALAPERWRGICDLHPTTLWSWDALWSLLVIVVATKILFSPGYAAFTSYEVSGDGTRTRGWRLKLFDWVTVFPVNYLQAVGMKFISMPVAAAVIWVFSLFGMGVGTSDVLPGYVFIAWTFMYLSRIANFFIQRTDIEESFGPNSPLFQKIRLPPPISAMARRLVWPFWRRLLLLIWLIGSWFVVWMLVERTLRDCGAPPNSLPTVSLILAAFVLTPIIEIIVGLIDSAFD